MVTNEAKALHLRIRLIEKPVVIRNRYVLQVNTFALRGLVIWTSKQWDPYRLALRPSAKQRQHYKKMAPVRWVGNKKNR